VKVLKHSLVYHQSGLFSAWPANCGIWNWDSGGEVLVGFISGKFVEQAGHNIVPPYEHLFVRSTDGGESWGLELPSGFPDEGDAPKPLPTPLDFTDKSLALRIIGTGYHGSSTPKGAFAFSKDRGRTWNGPFALGKLVEDKVFAELGREWELTPRTDYIPLSRDTCRLMLSARSKSGGVRMDRTFWADLTEGGRSITFGGWVVPPSDSYRAVMPATVTISEKVWACAIRRRRTDEDICWVDCYGSTDGGKTWEFLSKVGETGTANGNPPALVKLPDGMLCCVFGNRTQKAMLASVSRDKGKTWSTPEPLRDDFQVDRFGDSDFGYPRLFVRKDGKLCILYYFATANYREHHIVSTIFTV
jgi:hypothetical protein